MPGPTSCTRCGATLPETNGARVCAVCGQFHDATGSGPRPRFGSGAAPGPDRPEPGRRSTPKPGRPRTAQMSARARNKGGTAVGCLVFAVVGLPIIIVLVAVGLAVRSGPGDVQTIDGVDATDLVPGSGDLLVLPGDLADAPTVVTMATEIGGDSRRVVALVELEDGPVWKAPVVPEDVYSGQFAATDDLILASLGRDVVALDRGTGEVAWEAEASDEVDPSCPDCFAVVDDTLVVLGRDGEVTALDAATGEERWRHVFDSVGGRVLPLDDTVLLIDDAPAEEPGAALTMVVVRPSDGSELSRFSPGCLDPEFPDSEHSISSSPSAPIIRIPGTDDIVLVYGWSASCVQRWDVTTGEQRWSRPFEARVDWFDAADRPWALGRTDLVLAGYEDWVVVGLAEGGVHVVPGPEGSVLDPRVAVVGDVFVGSASSTRGTPEWSIVAHDLRSGDELWTTELGSDHVPLVVGPQSSTQSVYDLTGYTLLPDGDRLRLLTAGPPGPRFEVQDIDPATGDAETAGVAPIRTDSASSVGVRIDTVREGAALVDADGVLHVVDLASGGLIVAWGR